MLLARLSQFRTLGMSALMALALVACKKEELVVRPDNEAPDYDGVASVVVRNYVNRLFIDLLGRE
ncbi:MAG TPA: hypothetical protein PLR96_10010, partial [Flavobacteriales bacterium]|nr:hypothetical protein [Flavobacteriales bacterium]